MGLQFGWVEISSEGPDNAQAFTCKFKAMVCEDPRKMRRRVVYPRAREGCLNMPLGGDDL